MWNTLRAISIDLLRCPKQFTQAKRTTYILKRKYPVRLNKLGNNFPKKLKRRSFFYDLIEETDLITKPPIQVVLIKDVPGVGMRGDKVEKDMNFAYTNLLLPKLAIYAYSPEAKGLLKDQEERKYSSIYSKLVENYLASQAVAIVLSNDVQWTLKPWHVKVALRKNGILTNEDCITIPQEITGPSIEIENKDFLVHITMNKAEVYPVRCRIYLWSTTEPALNQRAFDINSPSNALFPEQKEAISKLIKIQEEIKKSQKLSGQEFITMM